MSNKEDLISTDINDTDGIDIITLRFPDNVRKRRSIWLRDPNHCVFEIIDNSVDEHIAGYCTDIEVTIKDKVVTVIDNGRGIPVTLSKDEEYAEQGMSSAEVAMSSLNSGGKFLNQAKTGGLNGVGASCVNATASKFSVLIKRDGNLYAMEFEKGLFTQRQIELSKEDYDAVPIKTGTIIEFELDNEVWGDKEYDYHAIIKRIKQIAYLNPGLKLHISIDSEGFKEDKTFYYENGLKDYLTHLTTDKETYIDSIYDVRNIDDPVLGNIDMTIAFNYIDNYGQDYHTFVNGTTSINGGSHLRGFKQGLSKAAIKYALDHKIIKSASEWDTEDCREGIIGIVSIGIKDPIFDGQGKQALDMPRIVSIVSNRTEYLLDDLLCKNPKQAKALMNKFELAAKARLAVKKARETVRKVKNLHDGSVAKLKDCTCKDPKLNEIYIVEGDSAGGSASQGRDREHQAILPIFGKIINCEKKRLGEVISNDKINMFIKALGTGIGKEFDISKLKYNKIIIMADADCLI